MGIRGPKPGDKGYRIKSIRKRFEEACMYDQNGCWIWVGKSDPKGYISKFFGSRIDGTRKMRYVHRVAYEEYVGPIPEGLTIDHLCENKVCCKPDHLEPVTNSENKKRAGDRMITCRRGHPRNSKNTYFASNGRRQCRVCKRLK